MKIQQPYEVDYLTKVPQVISSALGLNRGNLTSSSQGQIIYSMTSLGVFPVKWNNVGKMLIYHTQ